MISAIFVVKTPVPHLAEPAARHGHPEYLMIRLFANANYDFIKWRRVAFSVTGAIMLVGLVFLLTAASTTASSSPAAR